MSNTGNNLLPKRRANPAGERALLIALICLEIAFVALFAASSGLLSR